MFCRSTALFLILCHTCATSTLSNPKTTSRPVGRSSTQDYTRTRRGIVLVDDDFNVSPDPGVNQGWSDGKEALHKMASIEDGSGNSSELEDVSTPKYALKTSPGKLEMVSKETKFSSEAEEIEGSGEIPAEPIPNSCLNSTCDSQEIIVLPGHTEVVPVGSNISLICIKLNATEPGTLQWWYRRNESVNGLLRAVHQRLELTFDIPKSLVEHSGTYTCISSSRKSCCHRQLDVTVYEVPNYRYHLIIIGVAAAVSLFTCLLLAVCRNVRARKYEVKLELENMEADCIYKM